MAFQYYSGHNTGMSGCITTYGVKVCPDFRRFLIFLIFLIFFQILTPEILLSLFTQDRDYVTRDNETKALCTSEYSDISPLTGGNVVFTTLAGRASANDFENSPQLQVITLS